MSFVLLGILNSQAAGGGAGIRAYDYLDTVNATGSESSITISGLDSYTDYQDLEFRISASHTFNGFNLSVRMDITINGISSGENYYSSTLAADSTNQMDKDYWRVNNVFPDSNPTSTVGSVLLTLNDFLDTTSRRNINGISGNYSTDCPPDYRTFGGLYDDTVAINSITFEPEAGNFSSQSKIDIFGIKAA